MGDGGVRSRGVRAQWHACPEDGGRACPGGLHAQGAGVGVCVPKGGVHGPGGVHGSWRMPSEIPLRRLLLQVVCILLQCILVLNELNCYLQNLSEVMEADEAYAITNLYVNLVHVLWWSVKCDEIL